VAKISTLQSLWNDSVYPQAQGSELKDFERSLFSKLNGCQIFVTENKGLCGIVAANCNVLPGDEVAILTSGLTPFVLRQISATKYRLIIPYYFDDEMDCMIFGTSSKSVS
jgi:hypothetical protein